MTVCDLCKKEPADGTYSEVTAWVKQRDRGVNAVVAAKATGRRCCWACWQRLKRGVSERQGALL